MAQKPLFILGFPRSGTTLVRSRLSQHEDVHLVNEPEIVYGLRTAGKGINDQFFLNADLFASMAEVGLCRRHLQRLGGEYLQKLAQDGARVSFKEAYELLLPKPSVQKVFGEKSLNNAFFITEIVAMYPDALFINLIRDPRACTYSKHIKDFRKKTAKENPVSGNTATCSFAAKYAAYWSAWVSRCEEAAARHIKPANYLKIRYEDFVEAPDEFFKQICDRLNIDFVEDLINYDEEAGDLVLESESSYAHQNIARDILVPPQAGYLQFPKKVLFVIEHFSQKAMAENCYQTLNTKKSLFETLWVLLAAMFLRIPAKKYTWRKIKKRGIEPASTKNRPEESF